MCIVQHRNNPNVTLHFLFRHLFFSPWRNQHGNLYFRSVNALIYNCICHDCQTFSPLWCFFWRAHKSSEFPLLRVPYRNQRYLGKPHAKIRQVSFFTPQRSGFKSLQWDDCVTRDFLGVRDSADAVTRIFLPAAVSAANGNSDDLNILFNCIIFGLTRKPLLIKNPFLAV